ncbi:MAG TPA: hypothetical protein DCQ93_06715 [Bacteroidetes bacterium]|nr:hypothetical protein [Bacteroidota bacterium]
MKKLFFLLILCPAFVLAQKGAKTSTIVDANNSTTPGKDFYIKTYQLAMKYNDLVAATNSVYEILATDTSSIEWKDTLATLFLMRGAYDQAVLIGKELLVKMPDDTRLMELVAISLQSSGNAKESLEYYEKVYSKTQNLFHLYQIISLQFALTRLGECTANIDKMIQDPNSEKETVDVNVGQGYKQTVPYKAAALNIKGVIARQLNDDKTAEELFNQALAIYPDFVLAKGNIDDMKKSSEKKSGDTSK